ncbi:MAG: hypothetical protein CV087_21755 [Candidatus Brocadia sp. WS118]|nr:MAG: hypothetical protein CV087_21755 [Candidatus Brocadia sp. WS118]
MFRIELTVDYNPETKEVICYYRLLDHKALNWLMKQLIRLLRKKLSTDEFTITPNCIIFTNPFELDYLHSPNHHHSQKGVIMKKPSLEQIEKITEIASMIIGGVNIVFQAISFFKGKKS